MVQRGGKRGDDRAGGSRPRPGRCALHPPPRPRGDPRRLLRSGARLSRLRLRRTGRQRPPARPDRHPEPALLPAPGQGPRLLAGGRALVPLRLPGARGGHPPPRHDQPPGLDDPGGGGLRLRLPAGRQRPGGDQFHRRGRHLDRRLPRGAQHGRRLEAAAHPGDREQPLRLLDPGPPPVRGRASLRPRPGLRHRGGDRRRQRSRGDGPVLRPRRGPRPRRRGPDPHRGHARPHARPRRGGRFAEGRAARRARRLPRRRSAPRLRPAARERGAPPPRARGPARRAHPRAGRDLDRPGDRHPLPRRRGRLAAGLRTRSGGPAPGRRRWGRPAPTRRERRRPTSTPSTRRSGRSWSATPTSSSWGRTSGSSRAPSAPPVA